MASKNNEEIAKKRQLLIKHISLLLTNYSQKIDNTIAKMRKAEDYDNSDSDFELCTDIEIYLDEAFLILQTLTNKLQNSKDQRTSEELLDRLKETIEKMDQRVRDKCLPTRLDKIYEAIKTLLRNLIALFIPFEGRQVINKDTHTLTSARSTLFSEIETMKKSLNASIPEPETETPMIGLSHPRI